MSECPKAPDRAHRWKVLRQAVVGFTANGVKLANKSQCAACGLQTWGGGDEATAPVPSVKVFRG